MSDETNNNTQDALTQRLEVFYKSTADHVSNVHLTWLAANEIDAIGEDGHADLEKLRNEFPELFTVPLPKHPSGNAGNGTGLSGGGIPTGPRDMNTFIRESALKKKIEKRYRSDSDYIITIPA